MAKVNKRKGGLGKGLGAILSSEREVVSSMGSVSMIALSKIETNPYQPRTEFNQEKLADLADSIKAQGIIQPLTVRRLNENQYQLIAGERRLRASKLAGLDEVPAYIRTADDEQMLEMALIENIQRDDLNPIEIGLSYQRLIDELGVNMDEVAKKVGKKRPTINNYIRLLKLPPEIMAGVRDNRLSMGHARALAGIQDGIQQITAFRDVCEKELSVRQTEELARKINEPPKPEKEEKKASPNDIHLQQVEKSMEEKFGSRVALKQGPKGKGEIKILFNSTEDLNRLLEIWDL